MSAGSPIFDIPQVAPGQNTKEIIINNAISWLEGAIAASLNVTLTGNEATLTDNEYTQNMTYVIPSGSTSPSTITLTIPSIEKFFLVDNKANAGLPVVVGGSSGTQGTAPANSLVLFYFDGSNTRNVSIGGVAGGGGVLAINTGAGLIICLGCCHAGLINTLDYIRRFTGISRVRAIIGGFHLLNADERRLERTISSLKSFSPELIVPCHCTGEQATLLLSEVYRNQTLQGYSGMTLNF